ncbi:hypothetical protein Pla8534_27550 [Lignipirellula cremea]|uniref:Uncharacterized protein n=1 Tax=Lignipirellula cremea TaxID=2528010 RepID=A0A518DSY4_9BACT|nr:hypothetical protein Pla8534_27550 [Lignipirellula cremea]
MSVFPGGLLKDFRCARVTKTSTRKPITPPRQIGTMWTMRALVGFVFSWGKKVHPPTHSPHARPTMAPRNIYIGLLSGHCVPACRPLPSAENGWFPATVSWLALLSRFACLLRLCQSIFVPCRQEVRLAKGPQGGRLSTARRVFHPACPAGAPPPLNVIESFILPATATLVQGAIDLYLARNQRRSLGMSEPQTVTRWYCYFTISAP